MNPSVKRMRIYYFAAGGLTLIAAVLRSLTYLFAFDAEIGYFASPAFLPAFLHAFEIISVLCFLSMFPLSHGVKAPDVRPAPGPVGEGAALACALLFLANFILSAVTLGTAAAPMPIAVGTMILLLVAVAYFVLIFLRQEKRTDLCVLCGCGTIIASVLLLSSTYFDQYTEMNAPHKQGLHVALLMFMLYVLYELWALIGKSRPRMLAFSSMLAFFFCATVGVSDTVAFLAGRFDDLTYLAEDVLMLALAAYIGIRGAADALALTVASEDGETAE